MTDQQAARGEQLSNRQLAAAFDELADRLQVSGEQVYRLMAYKRAADALRGLPVSAASLAADGRLQEIPGVGRAIEEKIEQLLATGTFRALERARREVPNGLLRLLRIRGVGPSTARRIWDSVGAATFDDVAQAARTGTLASVPKVGPAMVAAILEAASEDEEARQRARAAGEAPGHDPYTPRRHRDHDVVLRDEGEATFEAAAMLLLDRIPGIVRVEPGGALARGEELLECIDLIAIVAADVGNAQVAATLEAHGWGIPEAESDDPSHEPHLRLEAPSGVSAQVWLLTADEAALESARIIGPREAADALARAIGRRRLPPPRLDEPLDAPVFDRLGLQYIEPEIRHLAEAYELAGSGSLPALVTEADVIGELHCHSTWTDGRATIAQMVDAAMRRGDRYLAITDHSRSLAMVGGLDEQALMAQGKEIAALRSELAGAFDVVHGTEMEILAGGGVDFDDATLAQLDWVVASIHVGQRQSTEQLMRRIESAMRNPYVDCIAHPTGRLLRRRPPAALDIDRLIELAVETGTFLEINANPDRMDLSPEHARAAARAGVPVCINSDAHRTRTLALRRHGVTVARRAGLCAAEVLNTRPWDDVRAMQKRWR